MNVHTKELTVPLAAVLSFNKQAKVIAVKLFTAILDIKHVCFYVPNSLVCFKFCIVFSCPTVYLPYLLNNTIIISSTASIISLAFRCPNRQIVSNCSVNRIKPKYVPSCSLCAQTTDLSLKRKIKERQKKMPWTEFQPQD